MINKIYVIESLRYKDRLTGKDLYYDIIERHIRFYEKEIYHNYSYSHSKTEFIDKLKGILSDTNENDEILIHIEAHGGKDEIQFGNYELLKWTELENYLIGINFRCKNKLHINLATCYGMYIAEKITRKKTAPFKSYISALRELSPSEIIEDNSALYEEIIKTRNIFKSFINFLQQRPDTQLRIKDIESVFRFILKIQISRTVNYQSLIKDFFDDYLYIQIDNKKLIELKTENEIVEYIIDLFLDRYLPK